MCLHQQMITSALAACVVVAGTATGAASQQRIDRRVAVESRASIRVHNLVGSTRIVGWEHDSLVVTGTVPVGGGRFDMGGGGSGAKLYVELPAGGAEPAATHLEVRVPYGARVWVKSASADIEVVGGVRAVDLNSVGGTVLVRAEAGAVEEMIAETMDGEIRVEGAGVWTRLKTASGPIRARGGNDVGIETVSGSVRYGGTTFQRLRIESVTGAVWFDGTVPRGARVEMESHAGRIELALPDTVSAEVSLTNFDGRIESAFGPAGGAPDGERRGEPVEFVVREGSATITVRNFKGDIVLRRS